MELEIDGIAFKKHPYIDINFGKFKPRTPSNLFRVFLVLTVFVLIVLDDEE